jgi:crotonobetainyl-CoA:carnitine CoA-transferase CaiB-like acyl-CoA transferase
MSRAFGSLRGVKIIEMPAVGPLQLLGTIFADLGATVLRIERPPGMEKRRDSGVPELGDPAFNVPANWPELSTRMEAIFVQHARDEWVARLAPVETCVTPAPVPRFSRTPAQRARPPALDEAMHAFCIDPARAPPPG